MSDKKTGWDAFWQLPEADRMKDMNYAAFIENGIQGDDIVDDSTESVKTRWNNENKDVN